MAHLEMAEGATLRAILEQTYTIWSEGLTPKAYERYYMAQLGTAWGRRHLRRFALVAGTEVAASAKEYTFDAVLDGAPIRVVGLGAVFTNPAHRGRGAARGVIEELVARAAADGADVALLFSEIGADYYARLGFETIAIPERSLRVTESVRHGAPATLVRAAEDRDLADIVAMGHARARPCRFHLARDRDVVQYAIAKKRLLAGLGPAGVREVQFFIAEEGASAVAYVMMTASRRLGVAASAVDWRLEECGDRDPAGARVGAILQTLIARDPAEARPPIAGWLPAGFCPPQITIVAERPSSDVMMVRALSARAKEAMPIAADDVLYWRSDVF
jgi:GNAT superfamily N-acetyltransferase